MTAQDQFSTPQATQAEQSVLGALLIDNDAIDRMGRLRAEDFYRADHAAIFGAITGLIAAQQPADIITVQSQLQATVKGLDWGGLPYLHSLEANTPSSANIGRYAELVRDKALMRGLLRGASDVHDMVAVERSGTATEMLEKAQSVFGYLADQAVMREPARLQQVMSSYIEDLDSRTEGTKPKSGMETGLIQLDNMLNGGLHRGKLYVIGARPGMGKTAFAMTVASNVAEHDRSVLFLSMEMPASEVAERAIAGLGKVSSSALAAADEHFDQALWENVTKAAKRAAELNFFVDDEPALSLLDVVTKARAIKRKHGLDILVVDYLQLMSGTEMMRVQQIETITKGLKVLAKTLNIAVIALSQLSRKVEERTDKRPILADLRESGSIEQDADVVLMLYREEQDNPETEWKGLAEAFIRKQRGGKTGAVQMTFVGEYTRFENYAGGPVADYAERKKPARSKGFQG